MLTLLAELAGSFDPAGAEKAAMIAARVKPAGNVAEEDSDQEDGATNTAGADGSAGADSEVEADDDVETPQEEILFGEGAVEALNPAVNGPAIQVLPLAICT